jgi:copper chaperone CopZ
LKEWVMDGYGRNDEDDGAVVLAISGMTCGGCANTVRRVLSRVPGVVKAEVDLAHGRAVVTGGMRPEELVAAVEVAGYGAQFASNDASDGGRNERGRSGCC